MKAKELMFSKFWSLNNLKTPYKLEYSELRSMRRAVSQRTTLMIRKSRRRRITATFQSNCKFVCFEKRKSWRKYFRHVEKWHNHNDGVDHCPVVQFQRSEGAKNKTMWTKSFRDNPKNQFDHKESRDANVDDAQKNIVSFPDFSLRQPNSDNHVEEHTNGEKLQSRIIFLLFLRKKPTWNQKVARKYWAKSERQT